MKIKFIPLRLKIFLTFLLLVITATSSGTLLIDRRFQAEIRDNLEHAILSAREHFLTYTAISVNRIINQAASLSRDARLQASLATMDQSTIAQTIAEINRLQGADVIAVLNTEGQLIAGLGTSDFPADLQNEPVLEDATNGYESGDIWVINDNLADIAAIPVVTENVIRGILLLGSIMDQKFLDNLRNMTESHYTILVNNQVPFSTYYLGDHMQTTRIFSSIIHSEDFFEFEADGAQYLGISVPITNVREEFLGWMFIYQSLDRAFAKLKAIRVSLVAITLMVIIMSLITSWLLARQVTRPVEHLSLAIRRFGEGQEDVPVSVESRDEIADLATAFNEMRTSLSKAQKELVDGERLSTVGRMANGIIHDFKQPITVIQGFAELQAMPEVDGQKRAQYSSRILESLQHMMGMINDLLDFARGETSLNLEKCDLNTVIDRAVQMLQTTLDERHIELSVVQDDLSMTLLDQRRIQRVVENLIGNARDALEPGGKIFLETRTQNGGIEFVVRDTGPGIPPDIQPILFEPFVTSGKSNGTGLGLTVTKNIIDEHGGKISFTTSETEGTTFNVWLPLR